MHLMVVTSLIFIDLQHIEKACLTDSLTTTSIQQLNTNSMVVPKGYSLLGDTLFYKGQIFVPSVANWRRPKIIEEFYATTAIDYSGISAYFTAFNAALNGVEYNQTHQRFGEDNNLVGLSKPLPAISPSFPHVFMVHWRCLLISERSLIAFNINKPTKSIQCFMFFY